MRDRAMCEDAAAAAAAAAGACSMHEETHK